VSTLERHHEAQAAERAAWGKAWRDHGLVFMREDGELLRPSSVTKSYRRIVDRAGLPPIRLHDVRHPHASLALAAGVDIKVVSDRLGHSTTTITRDL
jgi:integrase